MNKLKLQNFLFKRHLDGEENILYVGHKHWIEIASSFSKFVFLGLIIPWSIFLLLGILPVLILVSVITVIVVIKLIYIFIDWFFDAVLITNKSLILVEWHGIFHHESSRISYESVESIGIETKGVLGSLFNFGVVSIEREAAPPIEIENIKNPKNIELKILHIKAEMEETNLSENTEALHEILANLVAEHIKKHGWKKKTDKNNEED